jgi:hypothetical protein
MNLKDKAKVAALVKAFNASNGREVVDLDTMMEANDLFEAYGIVHDVETGRITYPEGFTENDWQRLKAGLLPNRPN